MVMATSLLFGACNSKDIDIEVKVKAKENMENVIGRSDIKVKDGRIWAIYAGTSSVNDSAVIFANCAFSSCASN